MQMGGKGTSRRAQQALEKLVRLHGRFGHDLSSQTFKDTLGKDPKPFLKRMPVEYGRVTDKPGKFDSISSCDIEQ